MFYIQIISNERFEKLKLLFAYHDISLSDNDIALYSNAFEIISQFVNNKLTNEEIFAVYDLLSDVVKNQRPDIVSYVPKEDRIRVQVRLMEELKETKGKLNSDEKIALAFCIYTGECTQVYDKESNSMCNGIVLFDSFEHIKNELEYEKKQFPSIFKIENEKTNSDETYGYTKENPIKATSIDASYFYLSKLRYNGLPVTFHRLGSYGNSRNEIIDGYDIFIEKKSILRKKTIKVATIYINPYCEEMPKVAPKNFTLI